MAVMIHVAEIDIQIKPGRKQSRGHFKMGLQTLGLGSDLNDLVFSL